MAGTLKTMEKMKKIKAVLFDLDGTLINSTSTITLHFVNALEEIGLKHAVSREEIARHLHLPYETINHLLNFNMDDLTFSKFVEIYRNNYLQDPVTGTTLYPGVSEVLKELKSRGIKISLATGKRTDVAKKILTELGVASYFDHIQGWDKGLAVKPAPDILLRALQKIGIKPSEGLMVGDTHVDILASKTLGIKVFAAAYGFEKKDVLEKLSPDGILNDFFELPKKIGKLAGFQ